MSSYVSSIFKGIGNYFSNPSNQQAPNQQAPNQQNDRAQSIYHAINWQKSVIGGSYALHQFHSQYNPHRWEPDDIDIMIGSDTEEDFQHEARSFEERCPEADLIKYSRKAPERGPNDCVEIVNVKTGRVEYRQLDVLDSCADIELFHEYVYGSRTYQHPTAGKIQLVHIKPPNNRSLLSVLSETTDIPACVSYTVESYQPLKESLGYDAAATLLAMRTGVNPVAPPPQRVTTKIWHFPDKGREILLTGSGLSEDICPGRKTKYEQRGYTFYDQNN